MCFCVGAYDLTRRTNSVCVCKCWPSSAHHNANTFKLDLNLSFKPAAAGGLWLAATLCMHRDSRLYVCVSMGQRLHFVTGQGGTAVMIQAAALWCTTGCLPA